MYETINLNVTGAENPFEGSTVYFYPSTSYRMSGKKTLPHNAPIGGCYQLYSRRTEAESHARSMLIQDERTICRSRKLKIHNKGLIYRFVGTLPAENLFTHATVRELAAHNSEIIVSDRVRYWERKELDIESMLVGDKLTKLLHTIPLDDTTPNSGAVLTMNHKDRYTDKDPYAITQHHEHGILSYYKVFKKGVLTYFIQRMNNGTYEMRDPDEKVLSTARCLEFLLEEFGIPLYHVKRSA